MNSSRTQAFGTDLFSNLGIDLAEQRIIVVKSMNHFHAAFSKVADEIVYCDAGGALTRDFRKVAYTRVQRPLWPLDPGTSGFLW